MSKKTYYVTTPIYYPSDNLHIGNAYCSTVADTIARFHKLIGEDTFFLTGTDDHGQKIERRAAEQGVTPQAFVDQIVAGIQELWKLMDVQYDDFIRTSQPRHMDIVQRIFQKLYDQGDIYKGSYDGWYCTPCESYWTQIQLVDGKCPDCGREVERTQEESYFLRLSKYQDWLIEHIAQHPEFIQPAAHANEMLNNFLRPGLEDLSVSRTSVRWGVPVPFDPAHTIYVWIDALSNYITALGYDTADDARYQTYWPADLHLVGKEITRFHTIIWPIMLHMLGLPLPRQVFVHGWIVLDGGQKMSKSKGNVIDPVVLCGRYGVDAIRYFLIREITFGSDCQFSNEGLLNRINADLANDLGNLVSRSVAMIERYFEGLVPLQDTLEGVDRELIAQVTALRGKVHDHMQSLSPHLALQDIWQVVRACNRYIDRTAPWILAKNEAERPRLGTVLYTLAESIRVISILIQPVMPQTYVKIRQQLGLPVGLGGDWDSAGVFGVLPVGTKVVKGDALFPRLDVPKEMEALGALLSQSKPEPKPEPPAVPERTQATVPDDGPISIDDFLKTDLRTAKVLHCEKVEGSDKLLKFTLDVGGQTRTIVSGIAKWYEPEQLLGKTVIVVFNLKPAKLRGIVSEGMILSAEDEAGNLSLLTLDNCAVNSGARVR